MNSHEHDLDRFSSVVREDTIEYGFIGTLQKLEYEYRPDITNRATLEANFREKLEGLNRVRLTDAEFARLLDQIFSPNVFAASKTLRGINSFTREDGTPLNYTLVNIKDWCKNTFDVFNHLRINTDHSHHRYDVILLINGVPCVQIELKTLGISPRRAMEHIVEYKNDPGNGYTRTLLTWIDNGKGHIWHTTGSGKTLTSIKTATLLMENEHIHKCVFVVDREDLDRQICEKFDQYKDGELKLITETEKMIHRWPQN